MREQASGEKVKIFISSKIDEKFITVRKSLKLLLEETNTNNEEKDIRFYAVKILVELSKEFNGNEILKIFFQMMDEEVAHIKMAILARIKKIDGNKKIVDAIFQKGRIDNHFGVRRIAEEYDKNLIEM